MYIISTKITKSNIEGLGVFAQEQIAKGKIVWQFKQNHDIKLTPEDYSALPAGKRLMLDKTAYLSPWTGYWVFPPDNDPAQYTNHSNQNNLSVVYDKDISTEPYFIANRDIRVGEELTNNYHDFDKITQDTKPVWAN